MLVDYLKNLLDKLHRSLPNDVLFLDRHGNHVTRDGIRSSLTVEELIAKDKEENPRDYADDV